MQRSLSNSAVCTFLTLAAAGMPAHAQIGHTAISQGADTTAPSVDNNDQSGEIIVTARKRKESLQNVPASIQVVSGAQIKALNSSSLSDLNGATPNASINPAGGPTGGGITIRGIASNTRNVGFEAGAALYVDGVYQGRPAGNDQDLIDIERVEILRGPQGTLYGKNTTAGAFSLTTASPGDSWRGKAVARFGNRNEIQGAAYVAGPLVADTLGVKLAMFRRQADGYQQDVNTGIRYGNIDAYGGRAELRFTPGSWIFSLRGDYNHDTGVVAKPEPVTSAAAIPGIDTIASDIRQPHSVISGGASLTINHDFGFGEFTSVSAWRRLKTETVDDSDYYVVAPVFGSVSLNWTDKARQLSQELRLSSEAGKRLSYVLGLYYFNQSIDSYRPFNIGPVKTAFFDLVNIKTDSYAAFVNADYHITDRLILTGGIRYTLETKNLDFQQKGFAPLGYPTIPRSFDHFTDRDLSPTASLRYEFTPDVSAYVTVSRGFKAGGWNPDITTATTTRGIQFGPEKVTNYEAGLRTQFLNRHLTVNLTGYHMDYENLQVSQFIGTNVGFVVTNAGKAVINGTELEVISRPVSWLSLNAGGAYNDAHYTEFLAGTGANYAGQQFTNAPKFSAYVSADVTAPTRGGLKFLLHGDYRYQSSVFFTDSRAVNAIVGPYARNGFGLANARIGLASDNGLEVSFFVQNVANKRVLLNRSNDLLRLGIVTDNYGFPRQYGVRLGYTF